MCLYDKLCDTDTRGLISEIPQEANQFVRNPKRQIGKQTRTQTNPLQFGVFLSIRPALVVFPFPDRHLVDGIEYVAKRRVLAHQRVASGDQYIPELCVIFKIAHQAA